MSSLPDASVKRFVRRARTPTLMRITVSPPVARFLVAAGARPAPPDDSMDVRFGPGGLTTGRALLARSRTTIATRRKPRGVDAHYDLFAMIPTIREIGFTETTYARDPSWPRAVLQARSVVLYFLTRLEELRRLEDTDEERTDDEDYILVRHLAQWANDARRILAMRSILGARYPVWSDLLQHIAVTDRHHTFTDSIYLRRAQEILEVFLQRAARPTNVSGAFLGDLVLLPEDLDGIIWDAQTIWAGQAIADYARRMSARIGTDTFQIRDWQLVSLS